MQINAASSVFPGLTFEDSVTRLIEEGVTESFGSLAVAHVQLCPQQHGVLTEEVVDRLMGLAPETRFRLHANVRVRPQDYRHDASSPWALSRSYFTEMAARSARMGAPAYTLHAGSRAQASLEDMADNIRRIEDVMGVPVGVEGHYPDRDNRWLISDWREYEWLLNSGLSYALDLSHLNIVAKRTRERRDDLVTALMESERCIEIHLSGNDGLRDIHRPLASTDPLPWWWPLVEGVRTSAVLFSEGNQRFGERC